MKNKTKRKTAKKITVISIIMLIAVFLIILARCENGQDTSDQAEASIPDDGRIYYNDTFYVPRNDLDVVLILGEDKFLSDTKKGSYNNTQQTDFIMLLVLDNEAQTCTALQLNRDTMAEIQVIGVRGEYAGTVNAQLALAHTYGSGKHDSCHNAVKAVSDLLYGIKIDHYISFTMDAVSKVNDVVGGVTVEVKDDLTSVSPELQKGAVVTLMGETALSYVRARSELEDSSNLIRMERQRDFLEGLRTSLSAKSESNDSFLLEVIKAVSPYITSDCSANGLAQLYGSWTEYDNISIRTVSGEAVQGEEYMEFYPDEAVLKQLVIELFYKPLDE